MDTSPSDTSPADTSPADTTEPADVVVEPPPGTVFFAPTVLHTVDIVVAAADLGTLDDDQSVRVPCAVTYDGTTIADAGCKKKGQSTLRPLDGKPSFTVKLDETTAGADIDGVQRFALNNTIRDPTFTSEPLTYLLYQRAGVEAPRTAHAVVRLNGEVKGLYVVVEGVNKHWLKQRFGDGSGNLYEGPWDFTQDPNALELKDEDEGRMRDDLVALTQAIRDADDAHLVAALEPLMDVDQTLTMMAVDMAYCLWDSYTVAAWNFYLYHLPGGRFVWVPHGADWPYYVPELDPFEPDFRPWGEQYPAGILAIRLIPAAADRYRQKLVTVRDQAFDLAALDARIDDIVTAIHSADTRIPILADEVQAFDDHLDEPRDFDAARRAFLDGAITP
ncbi:MAG: CotH kinase family protein [Myxococcota bacterium]